MNRLLRACVLAAIVFGTASAAWAQLSSADLVGRVTDSTGGVLPGATVTIRNVGTNDTRTSVTNQSGDYLFTLLPIGRYAVTIELAGFGTQTAEVSLATGDRTRLDSRLQPGTIAEEIMVTGEAPLLQTDASTIGALVTEQAVQDLPVNGRNFVRLVQLVPGANEGLPNSLASGTRPDDRRQTSAISINGAVDNQNNQMIDGADNNERQVGTIGVKPSIEAIAEVKVQTNLYTAEVGRTAGGVVNLITKSGTNALRGSAFEFVRNDRFDSRDFFATTKPLLRQHQFGGSLGGPLKRDRTFFFADYEGFRHDSHVVNTITVPTTRMRNGDFSELSVPIYDPLTTPRTPFPGNQIPLNRLDPIALRYLGLYPLPTNGNLAGNHTNTAGRTQDSETTDVRIDHRFSGASSIFGRYSFNNVRTFVPGACPALSDGIDPGCGTGVLTFPGPNKTKAHGTQVNYVRVLSPSLVSEVRAGYLNVSINSLPLNFGNNISADFGLPGVNFDEVTSGLMPILVGGLSPLGEATFLPIIQEDDTWQINGSITKTHGPHTFKLGAGYIARRFKVFQSNSALGQMTFDALVTNNGQGAGGDAFASFLLGYPSQSVRSHSLIDPWYHTNEPSAFIQDDWRATSWLTVNAGLRYDVFTAYTEEGNQLSNFDLTTSRLVVAGRDGTSESAGVATDYGNVAPRLGLSATLPGGMVVRGGYGLAFFPGNQLAGSLMKNPPFVSAFGPVLSSGTTGGAPNLRLADGMPPPAPSDYLNPVGSIAAVSQTFKSTRVQQFNVLVENELHGNVIGAAYIGTRGDRVVAGINKNLAPVGPGAVQARRPYVSILPGVNNITISSSEFDSSYDALQLIFQRRYRGGLSVSSNYTLAHNRQTSPALWDMSLIEEFDQPNDVRHRWVMSATYELPWGKTFSGASKAFLADWQINAIAQWQTGLPFDITNSAARTNTGGTDRPNLVGDPEAGDSTLAQWFNTAAFEAQPINTIGSAVVTRNFLHGPSQRRVDLSLFKDVTLASDLRLQLRIEAYNVTNTASFANPNGALGNTNFGRITSTVGTPRQMQFAVKLLF